MTYNMFGGTLNLAQLQLRARVLLPIRLRFYALYTVLKLVNFQSVSLCPADHSVTRDRQGAR